MFNQHRADTVPKSRIYFIAGISALVSGLLACRPVIAIGWGEFLFVFLLVAVLLGLPLFRFLRSLSDFHRFKQNKKK